MTYRPDQRIFFKAYIVMCMFYIAVFLNLHNTVRLCVTTETQQDRMHG